MNEVQESPLSTAVSVNSLPDLPSLTFRYTKQAGSQITLNKGPGFWFYEYILNT